MPTPPLAINVIGPVETAILLVVVGVALLVTEVFFPSAGVLGFCSAAALLAAVWFAYEGGGVTYALSFALAEVVGAPVALYFAMKYLPRTPIGRTLVGDAPTAEEVTPEDARHELVGSIGVARSKMLPSGAVEIDGQVLDAVSQGRPIEPGQYVKVVEVRGNRVVVTPAAGEERPRQEPADAGDLLSRPLEDLGIDDDPLA